MPSLMRCGWSTVWRNTLAAHRRDLRGMPRRCAQPILNASTQLDLESFFAAQHAMHQGQYRQSALDGV